MIAAAELTGNPARDFYNHAPAILDGSREFHVTSLGGRDLASLAGYVDDCGQSAFLPTIRARVVHVDRGTGLALVLYRDAIGRISAVVVVGVMLFGI
jgi:hypothetical protein